MPTDDPGPEWIISDCSPAKSAHDDSQDELLLSARRAWPHVHAHANRELGDKQDDPENATLAAEVWEGVLQSIARSLHRLRDSCTEIANMDSYLIGTFRHRFNRARHRQQKRERMIQLVASIGELDTLASKQGLYASADFERRVLAKEAFSRMDKWMKRVWTFRQYGYSWKEIGRHLGISEVRLKMKFRYKLSILRIRLGG
jgi:DNA-directed RNA polymerase specialized sigma24 family protein